MERKFGGNVPTGTNGKRLLPTEQNETVAAPFVPEKEDRRAKTKDIKRETSRKGNKKQNVCKRKYDRKRIWRARRSRCSRPDTKRREALAVQVLVRQLNCCYGIKSQKTTYPKLWLQKIS